MGREKAIGAGEGMIWGFIGWKMGQMLAVRMGRGDRSSGGGESDEYDHDVSY